MTLELAGNARATASAHLEGDAGLLVQVHPGDDSASLLLHVKDAAAVGRAVQVHSVAHQTGRGALADGQTEQNEVTLLFCFFF